MNAFEKWSVWITSALTGLTGIGYFWAKYLTEPVDAFSVVNHPLEPWFLKAHILVSPLLLLAVGTILVHHVWRHYLQGVGKGRRSGILAGAVLLPMTVTGYLIQSVTHRGWVEALAIAHIVTGALYLVGLGLHQIAVRLHDGNGARRRRPPARSGGEAAPGDPVRRSERRPGKVRRQSVLLGSADRA